MRSRFTAEQIVGILEQAASGTPVRELCRKHSVSESMFYLWRRKYGLRQGNPSTSVEGGQSEEAALN